VNNRLISFTI